MLKKEDIQIRDPFVLPVSREGKYFLYGTTDKNPWSGKATGFDAYVSDDLENWDRPFAVFRPGKGFWADQNFWAPEVHYYNSKYYMFASFKADGKCRGTQILVADKPLGPFIPHSEEPVTPIGWECLDGTLYVDENSEPWIIFCKEWVQVHDGEMWAAKLSMDLKRVLGKPLCLFKASSAPWTYHDTGFITLEGKEKNYVTDGPFLYKAKNGELIMLWSSFTKDGYAIGTARSSMGKITGPWVHDENPLYAKDGGHGMLFRTFDDKLMLTIHKPNEHPNERAMFFEVIEENGKLK